MKIISTALHGVCIAEALPFSDRRGSFMRLFCEHDLADLIGDRHIVQINHSCTVKVGAVRGMHYQHPPHAEMKLVRCLKGRIWDVAVDLRAGSPTYLRWHAEELTPQNGKMMVIPEGCAHGFQALESDSEVLYLHTAFYTPSAEGGVRFDDPRLAIDWPLPIAEISERDCAHPLLAADYRGVAI